MAEPRDRRDDEPEDDLPERVLESGGGTIDDSTTGDPDTWDPANAGSPTMDSGDLGVDLDEMRRLWGGAIDPSIGTGMTIKVDEVPGDLRGGTIDESAEEFGLPPSGTVTDSVAPPGSETVADVDAVSDANDQTIADDELIERAVAKGDAECSSDALPTIPDDPDAMSGTDIDATFVTEDDDEFEVRADVAQHATLADSVDGAPNSSDNDATFVLDDDEEPPHSESPGQTLSDADAAAASVDNDRTFVLDEDDAPPEGSPAQTLADTPGAATRGADDNDQTFVLDDEDANDRTFMLDDSQEANSGSFSDPATMNVDRGADATIMGDDPQGPGGGAEDTWQPGDQARTFMGDDASISGFGDTGLGADVGITVRPRSFATGEAAPNFGADYEMVKQLGQGGMGVVYMARQASIDREVAVKMLKPPKSGKQQTARKLATQRTKFLAEAVVTGDLDHPNIVPVYDLGTDDSGSVFYSMKCVKGTPWDDVVGQKSLVENLDIFQRVADAVAFAHNRGVVHRDLKPENVMLGDFGEVLLMDWGLALTNEKFTKAGQATKSGSIGGTPSYMAPEMAAGDITKVGTLSDIYLLGAILYEIVAGHPPHSGADVMKCLYNAAKNVIVPTDKKGELVDIAMKAMASRRRDRYQTVQELQDAIREYQSHSESIAMSMRAAADLIDARKSNEYEAYARAMYGFEEAHELWPGNERAVRGISEARLAYATNARDKGDLDLASTLLKPDDPNHAEERSAIIAAQDERIAKQKRFALLKKVSVAAACLLFVVVTGAAVWINAERNKALDQEKLAVVARDDAIDAQEKAEEEEKKAKVAAIAEAAAKVEAIKAEKEAVAQRDRAEIEEQKARAEEAKAKAAAFDAWVNQKFAEIARTQAEEARTQAEVARNDALEAQKAEAKQKQQALQQELAALFAGYEAEIEKELAEHASAVAELERLSADVAREKEAEAKETALVAEREAVEARDAAVKAKEKEEYEAYVAQIGLAAAKIRENAFDSARDLLAECKPELRNWEWGRLMHLCSQSSRDFAGRGPVEAVAVSPDGQLVAAGTWTGSIIVWDRESGRELHRLVDGGLYVNSVAFSPDGKLLATGSSDAEDYVKLWDVATGKRIEDAVFDGHTDAVLSVTFDSTGKRLLTSSYDNTARVWSVDGTADVTELKGHSWWVWSAVFDPSDENRVVTASQDGTVGVWDVKRAALVTSFAGHDGPVFAAAVSPDGKRIVSGGHDKRLLVWDPATVQPFDFRALADGETPAPPEFRTLEGHNGAVRTIRFGHESDSSVVVTGGHDNTVRIWDLDGRKGEEQIKAFRGHDGWVRDVAFSPDGRWVVSASQDESAKLWSIAGYEEIRVLRGRVLDGHTDAVLAADFSGDGTQVITASRDRTARTYDVATGELKHILQEGHAFLASSSVFFPDRTHMATAAADNTTRIWDVRTGTQVRTIDDTGRAAALAISTDGTLLLTGGVPVDGARTNWRANLWNPRTGELIRSFDGHSAEVTSVAISADSSILFTGTAKGTGTLWNAATGDPLHKLVGHTERINAAAFLPDGSRVLTASGDHVVSQWDVKTGRERTDLLLKHGSAVRAMDVGANGEVVVTSADDGRIRIWNSAGGEPIGTLGEDNGLVTGVDLSADGTKVVTTHATTNTVKVWNVATREEIEIVSDQGSRSFLDWSQRRTPIWAARFAPDGTAVLTVGGADARLWDLKTGEERLSFSPHGAVAAAAFSPDGKLVVTGSWDFSAKVWSAITGRAVQKLDGAHEGYVNSARFSPDGRFVLTASDDRTAKLWDLATAKVVRSFEGHKGAVMHAAFSADGKRIVTASADTTARIWDVETGDVLDVVKGHQWGVLSAEFSRDGQWVVTGSEDNSSRVWELTENGPVSRFQLTGHTAAISAVAFSPDRTRVLTGSKDDTVKLWDAATGKEILTLDGHDEPVTAVTFSPDGRYALTAGRDGRAIVWLSVGWEAPAAVARQR